MKPPRETGLARWVQAIEISGSGLGWLGVLGGWILARNLLEGVLERPKMLGFDWREDLSAAMVFLHFPVFYLLVFAFISLWLFALTRRPVRSVLAVVALGFAVLPLAPLIDAVVSRGAGYDLNYLTGLGSFLWRFWDPSVPLTEVSPGQRVEIALACLLGALYVVAARATDATRSRATTLGLAVLAAIGAYVVSAAAGAWPSWFARWTYPAAASATAASTSESWERVYRLGGLIPGESRRLALVLALPLLAATAALALLHARDVARAWLRTLPWTRVVFYAGLVPAGAWIGWALYRPHLPAGFLGPADAAALAVLTASMLCAVLAAICWNDAYDREADRINGSMRPVAAGSVEPAAVLRLARLWAVAAAFLALLVSYSTFLLLLGCLTASWAYSAPPLRLKRIPVVATGTLGLLTVLSVLTGFALFAQETSPIAFPPRIAWALFLGVLLGFTAKDLKDRDGDARTGVVTLATLLPPPWDRRGASILVAVAYGIAGGLLLGEVAARSAVAVIAVTAIFAVAGVGLTLRLRRPDSALLVAFCAYSILVLALIARDPSRRREMSGVPDPDARSVAGNPTEMVDPVGLIPMHAACLVAERTAQEMRRREERGAFQGRVNGTNGSRDLPALHSAGDRIRRRAPFALDEPSPWKERTEFLELAQLSAHVYAVSHESKSVSPVGVLRRHADALTWLLDHRPFSAQVLDHAVRSAAMRQDHAGVIAASTRAIERGVRVGDFLRHRAAARLAMGDTGPQAEADLSGATLYAANLPASLVLAGDLHQRRDEPERAGRAYVEALRLDPAQADAWAGLGELHHAAGRLDRAVTAFERAAALPAGGGDPWILNNLGVALRDAGRIAAASAAFGRACQTRPFLPEPWFNLGEMVEQSGDAATAAEHYRRAISIDRDFVPAREALRRLGMEDRDRRSGP